MSPRHLVVHPHVEEGRSRYRQGCRCLVCKAAWREYMRIRRNAQREAFRASMDPDIAYPEPRVGK